MAVPVPGVAPQLSQSEFHLTYSGLWLGTKDRGQLVQSLNGVIQGRRHLVLRGRRCLADERLAFQHFQGPRLRGDRVLMLLDEILGSALVPVEHAEKQVVSALDLARGPCPQPAHALDGPLLVSDVRSARSDIL